MGRSCEQYADAGLVLTEPSISTPGGRLLRQTRKDTCADAVFSAKWARADRKAITSRDAPRWGAAMPTCMVALDTGLGAATTPEPEVSNSVGCVHQCTARAPATRVTRR